MRCDSELSKAVLQQHVTPGANFSSQATRKAYLSNKNHMLATLNFTGSEHWALFNFSLSTALLRYQ